MTILSMLNSGGPSYHYVLISRMNPNFLEPDSHEYVEPMFLTLASI